MTRFLGRELIPFGSDVPPRQQVPVLDLVHRLSWGDASARTFHYGLTGSVNLTGGDFWEKPVPSWYSQPPPVPQPQ